MNVRLRPRKTVAELDIAALKQSLQRVQNQSWRDIDTFTYEQASDKTSVNTMYRTSYVHYKRSNKRTFCEYVMEFYVDAEHTPTTPLRALTTVILQAVVLNFIVHMRNHHIYFDTGDQWSTASPTIGYRFFPRFYTDEKPDPRRLKRLFSSYQQNLLAGNFCKQLAKEIAYCADALELTAIDRATLNDILGGGVMGGEGWRSVADEATIRNLLLHVDCDVYDENDILY